MEGVLGLRYGWMVGDRFTAENKAESATIECVDRWAWFVITRVDISVDPQEEVGKPVLETWTSSIGESDILYYPTES